MAASAGAFPWSEHEPDIIRRRAAEDRAGAAKRRRRRLFQTTKTVSLGIGQIAAHKVR
jgi:hypothetical protein